MQHEEDKIQVACVQFFRLQYPAFSGLFFAVPNGGKRNAIEAARLKRAGVLAGVSDLILLLPNKKYHGLCIEMKAGKNKQTEAQRDFQHEVEIQGYYYAVCRSFEDFELLIKRYFKNQL